MEVVLPAPAAAVMVVDREVDNEIDSSVGVSDALERGRDGFGTGDVNALPDGPRRGLPEGGGGRPPVDPHDAVVAIQVRTKSGTQITGRPRYDDGSIHGAVMKQMVDAIAALEIECSQSKLQSQAAKGPTQKIQQPKLKQAN